MLNIDSTLSDDGLIVTRKPLDSNRNPYGSGKTYTATVTDVDDGESDTNQGSQHAQLKIIAQPSKVA